MADNDCKICGGKMEKCFEKEMPPFGIAIYRRCNNCSFLYSDHIERSSLDTVSEYYNNQLFEKDDPGYISRAKTGLAALLKICNRLNLDAGDINLLDYGCGDRVFLSYCLNKGINATGYDPYYKSDRIPDEHFIDDVKLDSLKGKFDLVTCFEVVEHSTLPQIFSTLLEFCKPNGYLYFSTGMYNKYYHDSSWEYLVPAHCSIYSVESIDALVKNISVSRIGLIRQPFVDIPYILTGELWARESSDCKVDIDVEEVLKADRLFLILLRLLRGRLYKVLAGFVYRKKYFI